MTDELAARDAVIAHINTVLGETAALSAQEAADLEKSATGLPEEYIEVHVVRRLGGHRRHDGRVGTTGYRVHTRFVARLEANALGYSDTGSAALEYAVLTIGDGTSTPVTFESGDPVGPDDGWFSGRKTWTFTV